MDELTSKIEYMLDKNADKVVEFIKYMYHQDPQAVDHILHHADEDHITNKRKYDEHVKKLKWANKNGSGERWDLDTIKMYAKVDFHNVDFTEFDLAYLVNALYAKCCKRYTDIGMFVEIAKCLMDDPDEETKVYRGAYAKKHKPQLQGEQAYYNDYEHYNRYDEEDRRGVRRYRNERMDDYENREYSDDNYNRRYRNENRYYKDTNMGF